MTTEVNAKSPPLRDGAMQELVAALAAREASAPTWCASWSAHELAAHVTGAAEERAALIEEHPAGHPPRATRTWEEREPPLRALSHPVLLERLRQEAVRFEQAVAALGRGDGIEYTGWAMTGELLARHSHSEAVLHRWDLVGGDDTSVRLLSDPALVAHAVAVFAAIPQLPEARRWVHPTFTSKPVRLRADDHLAATVVPGQGLVTDRPDDEGLAVDLTSSELPLVLWGRCPPRLRNPRGGPETIDEMLRRLIGT